MHSRIEKCTLKSKPQGPGYTPYVDAAGSPYVDAAGSPYVDEGGLVGAVVSTTRRVSLALLVRSAPSPSSPSTSGLYFVPPPMYILWFNMRLVYIQIDVLVYEL